MRACSAAYERMQDGCLGHLGIELHHVGREHRSVAADPDSIQSMKGSGVVRDKRRDHVLAEVFEGCKSVLHIGEFEGTHLCGRIPCCDGREHVRIAEDQGQRAESGLAKPDRPALRNRAWGNEAVAERNEVLHHEAFQPAARVGWMIAVPGCDMEAWRDQRQVVAIMDVQKPKLSQPIAESGAEFCLHGQNVQQSPRPSRRGRCRLQHANDCRCRTLKYRRHRVALYTVHVSRRRTDCH